MYIILSNFRQKNQAEGKQNRKRLFCCAFSQKEPNQHFYFGNLIQKQNKTTKNTKKLLTKYMFYGIMING